MRIPGSRPFRPPSQKERPNREQSWDNRFHLGKIPEYNAQPDKLPNPKPRKIRKKIIILPGKVKKPKLPSATDLAKCVSVKGLSKPPLVQSQIILKLTSSLISVWNYKQIPPPQREAFLLSIDRLPSKEKSAFLVKEMELLKNDRNLVQFALRAVQQRQESLKELIDFAENIDVVTNNVKHNCVESLLNFRLLTVQAVESIHAWRCRLKEISPDTMLQDFPFIWEGHNYLSTVQNDVRVLARSVIGTFFNFLENDPFLVFCRGDTSKVELPVEAGLLRKIRECEEVLKQEGMKEVVRPEVLDTPRKLNECRSSRLFLKEESKVMKLEPIRGEVEEQILQYALLVPENIQNSMGKVENAYANALGMRFPAYFFARISNEIVGLVTLNLENQKCMHKRLYISHFSTLQVDMVEKLLEILMQFIWQNYECIEVRIGIISRINDQGKYEADKSIKQHFDKLGFRWKQMIYTINETPVQLLGLRRADTLPVQCTGYSIFDDCIEMAYACSIQFCDPPTIPFPESYCSIIGISFAVKTCGKSSVPAIQNVLTKMTGVPPAFRFRKDMKLESALKDISNLRLTVSSLDSELETLVSCSALGLSWVRYLPAVLDGVRYTRIIGHVNVMISDSCNVYIVATEDPQYSVFFIPARVDDAFSYASAMLRNIESNGESQEIWVPSFCVEAEKSVGGVQGSNMDGRVVGKCVESYRFKLNSAMHPMGSLAIVPEDGALVLREDFVFGMIHHKVDEEIEVPLFVVQITKDEFLR